MADCSKCKKKRADAAPEVELNDDEKKILLITEMIGARQNRTIVKIVIWMAAILAAALVAAGIFFNYYLVKMNQQFTEAWSEYDYVSEEVEVDAGLDGVANYVGRDGVILNGTDHGTETGTTP